MKNVLLDITCGYIIMLPYDEEVDTLIIVSAIAQNDFECEFISKYRENIIHIESRQDDEDLVAFKMRLEEIVAEKRRAKLDNKISN